MSSSKTKIRKHKSGRKKIVFKAEIVTKDIAEKTLQEKQLLDPLIEPNPIELHKLEDKGDKQILKHKKRKVENSKYVKKDTNNVTDQVDEAELKPNESTGDKAETPKGESKRAKKRKKHEELVMANKIKVDTETQEKCLNYLSRWKHNRTDWRFEKLRQVWLQQNIFNSEKLPDKYWSTLLEYFENSKGIVRQKIIDEALGLIEKNEEHSESDEDVKRNILKRARDIIQYLQT